RARGERRGCQEGLVGDLGILGGGKALMNHPARLVLAFALFTLHAPAQNDADGGLPRRGYLGADLEAPSRGKPGAGVRRGTAGTAAGGMGLQQGDRITKINGQAITDELSYERVTLPRAGGTVRYEIARGAQTFEKQATLPAVPRESIPGVQVIYGSITSRGQRLRTITT